MTSNARTLKQVVFPLIVLVALGGLYLARAKPAKAATPGVFAAGLNLDDALARSEREGKPVFVFVTADWCGPCQVYKRNALSDTQVETLVAESMLPVYIDVDRDVKAVERLGRLGLTIKGVPTSALVRGGKLTKSFSGGVSASKLLAWLKEP